VSAVLCGVGEVFSGVGGDGNALGECLRGRATGVMREADASIGRVRERCAMAKKDRGLKEANPDHYWVRDEIRSSRATRI
jgi:hypothetical protein